MSKNGIIILILGFLAVGLAQCSPSYENCEGYKYSPITEVPARCGGYFNK